jgi:hypothetical protein
MILAALLLQAAAPAAATPPWAVQVRTSAKGSATSSSAWSTDNSARLVVRCDATAEKIVSLQFIPKGGFAAAQPRPVSINVDDGGWLGTNWQFPGNGAFISDDVVVTNLTTMIAQGKSIKVRVIDPDGKPVDAVFAGPGQAPIRQVLTACGYEFGKAPPRMATPAPGPLSDQAAKKAPDPDDD